MDRIKRFIECLLPETVCNLSCSYCYIIQENRRSMKLANLKYTPAEIAFALRKERLGGPCLISICGAGETLVQPELPEIVSLLLAEGHYLNITTNGTLSERFDKLIAACRPHISHLHVSFSLHYLELTARGLMDAFFENVQKMRSAGASVLVQMNLCDGYLPHLEEIKQITMQRIGALPQLALTRNEKTKPISIATELEPRQYLSAGASFDSPLFRFTFENFGVKRKEFCYAGDWSGVLNLETGVLSKCYANTEGAQNIFEDPEKPIRFEAVGKNCGHSYCVNSSHFMSLGVIPSVETPSYAALRNRTCPDGSQWMTPEFKAFTSGKLIDSNQPYSAVKKMATAHRNRKLNGRTPHLLLRRAVRKLKRLRK